MTLCSLCCRHYLNKWTCQGGDGRVLEVVVILEEEIVVVLLVILEEEIVVILVVVMLVIIDMISW